jgi:hypothetical protein
MSSFIDQRQLEFYQKHAKDIDPKYVARYNNKVVSIVSPKMVAKKEVTDDNLALIVAGHAKRYKICLDASKLDATNQADAMQLLTLYKAFTENEFALQAAWGFDRDANFHPSWEFPHCSCPTMDNRERSGTPYKVVTRGCKVHDH